MVGIVHDSEISLQRVKTILKQNDSPVLLEYCKTRYEATYGNKKTIWHILTKTKSFIEDYVIKYCEQNQRPLEFIDMDAKITLKRYYKRYPLAIILDLIKQCKTHEYTLNENAIQLEILDSINFNKEIYRLLIQERDAYMAQQIKNYIAKNNPETITVISGKAHLLGITRQLKL